MWCMSIACTNNPSLQKYVLEVLRGKLVDREPRRRYAATDRQTDRQMGGGRTDRSLQPHSTVCILCTYHTFTQSIMHSHTQTHTRHTGHHVSSVTTVKPNVMYRRGYLYMCTHTHNTLTQTRDIGSKQDNTIHTCYI